MMQARKRELLILIDRQYPLILLSEVRATKEVPSFDSLIG